VVTELHEANSPIDNIIETAPTRRPIVRYRLNLPTRTMISAIPIIVQI